MTKEKPILMSAPMVRAWLAGQKTQTRRLLYVRTKHINRACWDRRYPPSRGTGQFPNVLPGEAWILSPWHKAQPGDRLWFKETHCRLTTGFAYAADPIWQAAPAGKWTPSIFMPRAAARIVTPIVSVRIERLQAISYDDAFAEGIECARGSTWAAIAIYRILWEKLNGADSWDENPWVVVLTFEPGPEAR